MKKAIGLIETKGLVAAVAAADKALKTSEVILEGKEITEPGYVTVRFSGELSAIQIAVAAGAEAARDTGELISSLVIADPDAQLSVLLKSFTTDSLPEIKKKQSMVLSTSAGTPLRSVPGMEEKVIMQVPLSESAEKSNEIVEPDLKRTAPEKEVSQLFLSGNDELTPVYIEEKPKAAKVLKTVKPASVKAIKPLPESTQGEVSDTIRRLRMEALGKKINETVDEDTIVIVEPAEKDLNELNVHQLRKLARSTPHFPIAGRQISRAGRNELLKLFDGINH